MQNTSASSLSPKSRPLRIGVFDSGLGGLSVLQALRTTLPEADLLYVADSGHAPYGEKTDAFVVDRSLSIAAFLCEQGADILVVACNTATAAAVHAIRQAHPHWPIVGIEPGVKPAVSSSRNGRVGVMATTGTLRSQRFQDLAAKHGGHAYIHLQPCPGLAAAIESGDLSSQKVKDLVAQFCEPLRTAHVDTVVLGCTHYPFVGPLIAECMGPEVVLVDTSAAVARQTARMAAKVAVAQPPVDGVGQQCGAIQLWSSGDPALLSDTIKRWLGLDAMAKALP